MKILLINPPAEWTIQSCVPKILEQGLDRLPPLGLMSIASFLEKETNCQIEIIDAQIERMGMKALKEEIRKRKPDVVGITAMTFTIIDVIRTVNTVKEVNPDIKVILGGPHVIIYPEETMKICQADYLIMGEGEAAIKQLLENIGKPEELKKIKGIVFRDNEKIINTGKANFIENLDVLPFPARHLVPYKKYFSALSAQRPATTMFTSRGCPYQCLFCERPHFGKKFRARSAQNVVKEMELCRDMGIKEIFIYDDTFTVDRQRVIDICREIKNKNLSISWDIRTRVNTIDAELLYKMKKAGCQRIHYGVEAGTQKILDILRKDITLKQVEDAFRATKKAGIQSVAYFMIGSPTENQEDIIQTIKFIKKIEPDYIHVSITTPFPATDLYRLALDEKVLNGDVWQEFAADPFQDFIPPIWEKELRRAELFKLLTIVYCSFYLRPNYIFKKIFQLKSLSELITKGRAALKLLKFYYENTAH